MMEHIVGRTDAGIVDAPDAPIAPMGGWVARAVDSTLR